MLKAGAFSLALVLALIALQNVVVLSAPPKYGVKKPFVVPNRQRTSMPSDNKLLQAKTAYGYQGHQQPGPDHYGPPKSNVSKYARDDYAPRQPPRQDSSYPGGPEIREPYRRDQPPKGTYGPGQPHQQPPMRQPYEQHPIRQPYEQHPIRQPYEQPPTRQPYDQPRERLEDKQRYSRPEPPRQHPDDHNKPYSRPEGPRDHPENDKKPYSQPEERRKHPDEGKKPYSDADDSGYEGYHSLLDEYQQKQEVKEGDYGSDKPEYEKQEPKDEKPPQADPKEYDEPAKDEPPPPAGPKDRTKGKYDKGSPCPKAMSADAVESVLLGNGTFNWKEVAATLAPTAKRRNKRGGWVTTSAAAEEGLDLSEADTAVAGAAAYMDEYQGVADPDFLLPIDEDISGRGTDGTFSGELIPTDEALAVGPYEDNPSFVTILHSVNAVAEIIVASRKTGERIPRSTWTKIPLSMLASVARPASEIDQLIMGDPTAFYDCKAGRWVLIWTSFADEGSTVTPCLFMAVSHTKDTMGDWTVYALEARPRIPGYRFCEKGGGNFSALAPQSSYSHDGIFISIGASCGGAGPKAEAGIMSTLYAFSKSALYSTSRPPHKIFAATYIGAMSWKSSISHKEQSLIKEDYRTFNNLITPARPQDEGDVEEVPLFVMKVDGAYISVATLTDDPLDEMTGIQNAPSIRAIVISKGEDFSNSDENAEGNAIMPQPGTSIVLDSGDTGMLGGKYGIRAYGTIHHKGLLYTTMSEFFGVENVRMPSIYYGIIATHPGTGLCKAARKKWGFIASHDGLALAYPVVAARKDGSAIVFFSYSGAKQLPHSLGPAYPGVAYSIVNTKPGYDKPPSITIAKLGPAAIDATCPERTPAAECSEIARWGDYSALQVWDGQVWYAVPIAGALNGDDDYKKAWRSWIGVEDL